MTETDPETDVEEACPLKKLPAELRNYIFLLATTESVPIRLEIAPHCEAGLIMLRAKEPPKHWTGIALSYTCQQFHREVLPVFYAMNAFTLTRGSRSMNGTTRPETVLSKLRHLFVGLRFPDPTPTRLHNAYILVQLTKEDTLVIEPLGLLRDRCICALHSLAENYVGDGCLVGFLKAIDKGGFGCPSYSAKVSTPHSVSICETCGKRNSPRRIRLCPSVHTEAGRYGRLCDSDFLSTLEALQKAHFRSSSDHMSLNGGDDGRKYEAITMFGPR